jgi:hypothetical protein
MTRLYQVNRAGSILVKLDSFTSDDPIMLWRCGDTPAAQTFKADPDYKGMIGMLSNLRARVRIASINQVAFPDYSITDSDTETLLKTLEVQWNAERKQLEVLLSKDNGVSWHNVGSVSLLRTGYPYTTVRLMDYLTDDTAYEVPDGLAIGVSLSDVGTGLLGAGDDVEIYGSFVEEFTLVEPVSSVGSITTPDLTSIEVTLTSLQNAVINLATTTAAIQADLEDDPELADLQAIQTAINNLQLTQGDSVPVATTATTTTLTITDQTDIQILAAATLPETRVSVVVHNNSSSVKCAIQFGSATGAAFAPAFILDAHSGFEEQIWKGAIKAKALSGSCELSITELSV